MKKNKSTIILILVFFVGLSVMLYPTISDYVNQLHQTRAVANYAADVDKLSDADYTAYFEGPMPSMRRLPQTRMPCIFRIGSRPTRARWT